MSFLAGLDFDLAVATLVIFGLLSFAVAAISKVKMKKGNIFEKISEKREEKRKQREERLAKEPKAPEPQIVEVKTQPEPIEIVEPAYSPYPKRNVDFGVWQGIRFGFGFGVGVTIWMVVLSFSGLAFLAAAVQSLLGVPHF